MKIFISMVGIALLIFKYNYLFSDEFNPKTTPGNFHYSGKYCTECHETTPELKNQNLKYNGNFNILCKCHFNIPESYIHPVNIEPSKKIKNKIPPSFPLKDGKIVCSTCHDIYLQCQKSTMNKISLRGSPYPTRYKICYKCHNIKEYEMLNPHKQLDVNKKIIVERCLYCHIEKPDEKYSGQRDIALKNNIGILCQRCHDIRGNHSGNSDHLRKPSAKGIKRMNEMKKKFNIILPLDTDGNLTCATCHNPHETGVIAAYRPSAKGADGKYRHRLPGKMCTECHQK